MPLKIRCPSGHLLGVPNKKAGTTVRCPKCQQPVEVPPAKSPDTPPLPDSSEPYYDDPLPPPVQPAEAASSVLPTPTSDELPSPQSKPTAKPKANKSPPKPPSPTSKKSSPKKKMSPSGDKPSRETKPSPAADKLAAKTKPSPSKVETPKKPKSSPKEKSPETNSSPSTPQEAALPSPSATAGPQKRPETSSPQDEEPISKPFDPYYKWLAIAPDEQPANYYRLVGVREFEDDLDVIDSAAEQRITHLRKFQSGKHGKLSQQLLNEVSIARICLLDTEKRKTYNRQLERQLAKHKPPIPPPVKQDRPKPPPVSPSLLEQPASTPTTDIANVGPSSIDLKRPAPRVETRTPLSPAAEEASKSASLVDDFNTDWTQEEEKVAGHEHDPRQCRVAYALGVALAMLGLFTMIPGVQDIVQHLNTPKSLGVARWVFPLLVLGIVQLAYALYLFQLPDWGSVWVVTLALLILSAVYAVMMGVLFLGSTDQGLATLLQMHDRDKAKLWCLSLLSLTSLLTYFCGSASIRWHKTDADRRSVTSENRTDYNVDALAKFSDIP